VRSGTCGLSNAKKTPNLDHSSPMEYPKLFSLKHGTHGTSSSSMTGNRSPILSRQICARRSKTKQPRDWVRFLRVILPFFCSSPRPNTPRKAILVPAWTDPCTGLDRSLYRPGQILVPAWTDPCTGLGRSLRL